MGSPGFYPLKTAEVRKGFHFAQNKHVVGKYFVLITLLYIVATASLRFTRPPKNKIEATQFEKKMGSSIESEARVIYIECEVYVSL